MAQVSVALESDGDRVRVTIAVGNSRTEPLSFFVDSESVRAILDEDTLFPYDIVVPALLREGLPRQDNAEVAARIQRAIAWAESDAGQRALRDSWVERRIVFLRETIRIATRAIHRLRAG